MAGSEITAFLCFRKIEALGPWGLKSNLYQHLVVHETDVTKSPGLKQSPDRFPVEGSQCRPPTIHDHDPFWKRRPHFSESLRARKVPASVTMAPNLGTWPGGMDKGPLTATDWKQDSILKAWPGWLLPI